LDKLQVSLVSVFAAGCNVALDIRSYHSYNQGCLHTIYVASEKF